MVSCKVDVIRKLTLQHKRKSAIENGRPKSKPRKYNNSHLDVGSHLSCRTERNNLSVLFEARYWPAEACYQICFNVI